jgi:uncharacterized protein
VSPAAALVRHPSVTKLLVLIIAAAVIYVVLTGVFRTRRPRAESAPEKSAEPMVPCVHCGVNLPRSEALESGGRFYCNEEHRRLASG